MSEFFLSDAGSLFFIAWIIVVGAVSIVAFGQDLVPTRLGSYQRTVLAVPPKTAPKK
ncbi:MAG TPA: hypothetical protein VGG04_13750 [Candidatus Sulfotelmatobacter sp.]|jgi:hypothetical protein